jgi:putative flippase GtrA
MQEDVPERSEPAVRGRVAARFTRYSVLSLLTVPAGYSLFLLFRHFFGEVNAGLLNLGVGMVLTPPSFLMYRVFVWGGGSGRSVWAELFSFWQTVMVGALASSAFMAVVDLLFEANDAVLILAGLTGQGVIFIARFLWLDKVTFTPRAITGASPSPTGESSRN